MKSKMDIRKQLEAGMAVFLSEGKTVTKVSPKVEKKSRKPKEDLVEIEVDYLPIALKKKYFSES